MKLTEFIGITSRNLYVKFEAVWRSFNFRQKNADSAGPQKKDEILTFSQSSPKFTKLTEFIGITARKMLRNLNQFGEVSIFYRKMPTAPDLRKRMKF